MQCKLEFNKEKIQIVSDEAYNELAKVEVGENIEKVTMAVDGDFIINTIKGKEENVFYVSFKVNENVKLKDEKISLEIIDSTNELSQENKNYVLVGKQSIIKGYHLGIVGGLIIIFVIAKLRKTKKRRR